MTQLIGTKERYLTSEHWRQWIATLGPMILTAIGVAFWVVGAINNVHEDVSVARTEAAKSAMDVSQRVLTDEGRITNLERMITEMKSDNASFRVEVHSTLSQISSGVSDLRVELAKAHVK